MGASAVAGGPALGAHVGSVGWVGPAAHVARSQTFSVNTSERRIGMVTSRWVTEAESPAVT
jgi:hypothetical protein